MRKKIAIVVWDMSQTGGINQVAETMVNMLSGQYSITVISLVSKNKSLAYLLDKESRYKCIIDKECRIRDVMLHGTRILRDYIKREKIQLAFLMGFQVAAPVSLMLLGVKCKLIMCEHEALMSRWEEKKVRYTRYLAAKRADKVVTLTKQTAEDYCNKFHLQKQKVTYIYNSINEKCWKYATGYNENSKTILSVGRLSKEKGYEKLIEVADKVLTKHRDWKWFIYGEGEEYEKLHKVILQKDLEDNLILKGNASNLYELYHEGAIFVMTSYREGLPLVLMEAKVNYLPCVSFNIISGPSEIIRDGYDGFLIEPYDVVAMAEKINELIENKSLRIKFSNNAKDNLGKFDAKNIIKQWVELIENEIG